MSLVQRSVFEKLFFQDIDRETFLKKHWGTTPCVLKDVTKARVTSLFGSMNIGNRFEMWMNRAAADVDRELLLNLPGRIVGSPDKAGIHQVAIEPQSMRNAYRQGVNANYVIFNIDRFDEEVMQFRTRLVEQMGLLEPAIKNRAAAYLHRGDARGSDAHLDSSASFQINLSGQRTWFVAQKSLDPWNPTSANRDRDGLIRILATPRNHDRAEAGSEQQLLEIDPDKLDWCEWTLGPGDIIYVPPCTPHKVFPVAGTTDAITVFIEPVRAKDLAARTLQNLGGSVWNQPIKVTSSTEEVAKLASEIAKALAENPRLLFDAMLEFAPDPGSYSPAYPNEATAEVNESSLMKVPVNLAWFVIDRHSDEWISELQTGTQRLAFENASEAVIAQFLYEGGIFAARDVIAADGAPPKKDVLETLGQLVDMGLLVAQQSRRT